MVEFGNRVVAVVGILAALVTWLASRRVDGLPRWVRRTALAAFLGTIAQIPLGGLTVILDLHPLAVMSHFLLALVVVALAVVVAAITSSAAWFLQLDAFTEDQILETKLRRRRTRRSARGRRTPAKKITHEAPGKGARQNALAQSLNHEAHQEHEGKPDRSDEGFETPAALAGPASPGRGVREARDQTRRQRRTSGVVVQRLRASAC